MSNRSNRSFVTLAAVAALALGGGVPAAFAKHGADDPPSHHAGDHRHGADDPAGHDAGDDKGGARKAARRAKHHHRRAKHHRHAHRHGHGNSNDDGPNHT
jgi:hypothetical protein